MKNEIVETSTAKIWMNEDNICFVRNFPGSELTLTRIKKDVDVVVNLAAGKKIPVLIDIRKVNYIEREARLHISSAEAQETASANALLIGSPVSRVIGNFFMGINKPPYPIKLFTSEEKAIEWLKGFVNVEEN